MAQLGYLVSTVLMGLFLVAVVGFLRLAERREYSPTFSRSEASPLGAIGDLARNPAVWIAVFLVVTVGAMLAAVVFVGGLVPSEAGLTAAGLVLGAVVGLLVGGYLLWGVYTTARARGFHSAAAVMVSAWALGILVVVGIAAKLLVG